MKYKLNLLEPQRTTDRMGAETTNYVLSACVWAERVKHNGSRSDEVGEHFPSYHAEYNIRDAHRVDENWRVEEVGGHLYNVVAIVPNRDRGMLTLVCERVNE